MASAPIVHHTPWFSLVSDMAPYMHARAMYVPLRQSAVTTDFTPRIVVCVQHSGVFAFIIPMSGNMKSATKVEITYGRWEYGVPVLMINAIVDSIPICDKLANRTEIMPRAPTLPYERTQQKYKETSEEIFQNVQAHREVYQRSVVEWVRNHLGDEFVLQVDGTCKIGKLVETCEGIRVENVEEPPIVWIDEETDAVVMGVRCRAIGKLDFPNMFSRSNT